MKVVIAFILVSSICGLSILFSFKISAINYVTISNGTVTWITNYGIFLENINVIIFGMSLFSSIISNKIFLIILIIINCLLYIELRKMMNRKKKLTNM